VEGGRRYFHYKTDAPILDLYSIQSARYAVRRDRREGVNLEIYYQPGHEFNMDTMMQSMKETLAYCTANFSAFQFHQLRIIEFPGYGTFAESFANTIPFSEAIGFITKVSKKPEAVDLPFYVTAHETGLAHASVTTGQVSVCVSDHREWDWPQRIPRFWRAAASPA